MLKDFFIYSIKNLRNRKLRSWLTMIGIVIGITAVVSLIAMGQGLRVAISAQFGNLGTDILTVTASGGFGPPGTGVINPLTTDNLDDIEKVGGVEIAVGRLVRSIKSEYEDGAVFTFAGSMPDGKARDLLHEILDIETEYGRLLKDGDKGKVMIGNNLGGEEAGFGEQVVVGSKILIEGENFEVVGIVKKLGSLILDNAFFVNEDEIREILDVPDEELDAIAIRVSPGEEVSAVKERVEKLMRKKRDVKKGEEDFTVETPQAILGQVNSTLFAVQLFVYIIAAISIIVGGIGIMNTMFTSVLERTKEIGIMKSIGAKNSSIFTLFFIESGLIGSIGGILGAIFGAILALGLAFLGSELLGGGIIRAEISLGLILGSIMGSFVIGSIFGIIPAIKASKLQPVDALRHQK